MKKDKIQHYFDKRRAKATDEEVIVRRLRRLAKTLDQSAWSPTLKARVNLITVAAATIERLIAPQVGYRDFVASQSSPRST